MNTTVFPPASIPIVLQRTVSLGFVHGVIAPITPNGPISIKVRPLSPDQAVVVISSVPGVFSATSWCFKILCPTFPMPVSSTPMRARISAFSLIFCLMLEMIASLWSMDILATIFCVFLDASIASFISENTPFLPATSEEICIFATTSCTMSCTIFSFTDTPIPPQKSLCHRQRSQYLLLHCLRLHPKLRLFCHLLLAALRLRRSRSYPGW